MPLGMKSNAKPNYFSGRKSHSHHRMSPTKPKRITNLSKKRFLIILGYKTSNVRLKKKVKRGFTDQNLTAINSAIVAQEDIEEVKEKPKKKVSFFKITL